MRSLLVLVGIIIARLSYVIGVRKTITIENLKRAFPHYSDHEIGVIAKKSYDNLGRVFAEMIYLRFGSLKAISEQTEMTNPELYHESLAAGKGLIVVAAHYANWEWLALSGAMSLHSNFAIVRKNIQTSVTERFLEHLRLRSGNTLINTDNAYRMLRTLREGKCIAILADQAAPSESVRVRFLNTSVPTFEGPARLALASGAEMLFAECILNSNRGYSITFRKIERSASDTIESLTQAHASCLEAMIIKHPEYWLWQHRRWKNL